MTGKSSKSSQCKEENPERFFQIVPKKHCGNLLELLYPGSFVKLANQPNDLPPFQLIACKGGRCLVRQQSWGKYIHWEVDHRRLKSA